MESVKILPATLKILSTALEDAGIESTCSAILARIERLSFFSFQNCNLLVGKVHLNNYLYFIATSIGIQKTKKSSRLWFSHSLGKVWTLKLNIILTNSQKETSSYRLSYQQYYRSNNSITAVVNMIMCKACLSLKDLNMV